MGPSYKTDNFSSGDVQKSLVSGKIPRNPNIAMPVVDVRNVAYAHL